MRFALVRFMLLALCPLELAAQSHERVSFQLGAWEQVGAKDPLTDKVVWAWWIQTTNLNGSSSASALSDDVELWVSCQTAAAPVMVFNFSYRQPLSGVFVDEGDSIEVQFRFDAAPALTPFYLFNPTDSSGGPALRSPEGRRAEMQAAFRRHSRTLMQVRRGTQSKNYYFALNGYSRVWDHCRRTN